jgi:hypothetical protein
MLELLCWLVTDHRDGSWEDYREPPFEDGRSFEVQRCRYCRRGMMRAKPYDMARLERAARLDGIDPLG